MALEENPTEGMNAPVEGASPSAGGDSPRPEAHPMSSLLADSGFDLPKRGEIREGTIARITPNELLVDVGAKTEGTIGSHELAKLDPEVRDSLELGQSLTVYVVNPHDRNGSITLSITKAEEVRDWQLVEELLDSQEVHEGELTGYNKGGLILQIGQLRGFIPASQMSMPRRRRSVGDTPAKRWSNMVGESTLVKVIEVDQQRNRLILSERAAAKEQRARLREKLLDELQPGDVRTGHVNSLADFGAFVDLGGAEGLVHLSELTWKPVDHPREVLKVGQEVEVYVINVDHERNRIGLSLKRLEPDPWDQVPDLYQEGQLVEATITRLTKFGAFARLKPSPEIEGLVRISELSHDNVAHPKEVVREGEERLLRIIRIEADKRRMALSIKEVDSARYADLDYKFYVTRDAPQDGDAEAAVEEAADEEPDVAGVVDAEAESADLAAAAEPESEAGAAETAVAEPETPPAAETPDTNLD